VLHHRIDGAAPAPALVLGPSLGTSLAVWDAQVPALARQHRVVRWDLPGHGRSAAEPLPESLADLGGQVLALVDSLGIDRFAYAGVSLGGAVGTWLAAHHPERITSLVLVCTAAEFGGSPNWHERAALVREEGTAPLADATAARWFTPGFKTAPAASALLDDLRRADARGYAACCEVLGGCDLRPDLAKITAPALVIAGREDPATPPRQARELADGIAGATLVELSGAAHLAGVERAEQVTALMLGHLGGDRHTAGMAVRRAVLGDAHVARAIAGTTDFTAPFQDFITRYAWGEIWTRPGLSRKTRSCITLTALVAGGHHDELAMHVRAALRNGLTPEEIQEVLLQTAVYCGVPAANSAFAIAARVLAEET
jgi:3-oxoadipate enol-lactonase / 4-carboxymuconolactone decarboxylase